MNDILIKRALEPILHELFFKGKTIILLGARQVGKTTLMHQLEKTINKPVIWMNGDNPQDRDILSNINSSSAQNLFPPGTILFVDEAQRITNTGLSFKIIHDNCSDIQILLSGSSAFEITDKIKESMTGRKFSFKLFPFSSIELIKNGSNLEYIRNLEDRIIFGSYPDVINKSFSTTLVLRELISDYLFKDILTIKEIRKPDHLEILIKAIAFQIGNHVSYRELSSLTGIDKETVERYIRILEESFILFRLNSFSRNLRNELKQSRKIYFYDNGIRNAVINQFAPLSLRNDVGPLWENFLLAERLKRNHYIKHHCNSYFWRTASQQEIDYIEEYNGEIHAYEFKYKSTKKVKFPNHFINSYQPKTAKIISMDNFLEFVQ